MKKSSRRCSIAILMMICLCIVLSIPSIPVQAADNLSENEMIYGADIGFLSQLESQGVEWVDDNGNTRDALELLKEKGVNAVRLRVFVKPPENFYWTKPDGTNCMLGYADTQGLLYTAKRAKDKDNAKIDFSNVKVEPLFEEEVDFDTFSKSDFRAVKVKECVAVPKSKKLLQFTLDDGTGIDRTILSGIHAYYEPEELVGKTLIAITNLPPRKMMGIESCGMLLSAVNNLKDSEDEELHLIMVDNHIPAGAKLY